MASSATLSSPLAVQGTEHQRGFANRNGQTLVNVKYSPFVPSAIMNEIFDYVSVDFRFNALRFVNQWSVKTKNLFPFNKKIPTDIDNGQIVVGILYS